MGCQRTAIGQAVHFKIVSDPNGALDKRREGLIQSDCKPSQFR